MRVLIFQPMLKQYRVPLFEKMERLLAEQGHELRVVSGSPPLNDQRKGDNILESKGCCIVERSLWLFRDKLHFLNNAVKHILWADFVITEQANKHVHNYLLMGLRLFGIKRFAYWGHGQNRQGNPNSWRERMKKRLSVQCDWWFAYTDGVANYVAGLGYPKSKITALNNSVDTSAFKQLLAEIDEYEIAEFKSSLGIQALDKVGMFCGSLYGEKKLEFLLRSSVLIRESVPDFVLLIIGDGLDKPLVEKFAENYPFIKYLGPLFGREKAVAFKSSHLFLCPGLVGLAILDAFVASLPLLTCDIPNHSPEIEYLENQVNGIMTRASEDEYAGAVSEILANPKRLNALREGADSSSTRFSIENMALNFVNGICGYFNTLGGHSV